MLIAAKSYQQQNLLCLNQKVKIKTVKASQ